MNANNPHASQRLRGQMMRLAALCAATALLTLGGGVSAALADPAGSPGAGYDYGIAFTDSRLPTTSSVALKGGWDDAETRVSYRAGTGNPTPQNPIALQLAEPFYQGAGWVAPLYYQNATADTSGGGSFQYSANYVCASSQWSQSSDQVTRSGSGLSTSPTPAPGGAFLLATGDSYDGSWICPYLVRADVELDTYSIAGVLTVHHFSWHAGQFAEGTHLYNRTHNPGSALCNDTAQDNVAVIDGYSTGACDAYVTPDPTTAAACGTPPALSIDPATWGAALLFWPVCWFVPKGGLDRNGALSSAWNASAMGQLQTDANELSTAFAVTPSCGQLGGSLNLFGATLAIDTCSWSSWTPAAQTFLDIVLTIGFGVWAIRFLWSTLSGLVGAGKPPIEGGD